MTEITGSKSRHVTPVAAAWLSFLVPGLGQLAAGRVRRAAVIALPLVALLVTGLVVVVQGSGLVLDLLLQREVIVALVVGNAILLLYHLVAIVDAYRIVRAVRPATGRLIRLISATGLTAALLVAVAGHGALGYVGYRTAAALTEVFAPSEIGGGELIPEPGFAQPEPTETLEPTPSSTPVSTDPVPRPGSSSLPTPVPTPAPTPVATPTPVPGWAMDGRLNLLLIGSDAGPDRWSLRTDTMIVLSVEVATGRGALFGIPRNLVGVPLPPESAGGFSSGRFPGLLNALHVYATGHPNDFPGGETRGLRAVAGAIQELVGVRLDGLIVVNLHGFIRLVEAIDGLWIDVPDRLVDRFYPLSDGRLVEITIEAGCQRFRGERALAYARSRHQDSDYGRMKRQQLVLVALRRQLDPIAMLPRLPALLDIAGDSVRTSLRPSAISAMAKLADRVRPKNVEGFLFVPPRYPSHLDNATIERIRSVVRHAFDGPAGASENDWEMGRCP